MEALQITEDKALNLLENARDAELVFDWWIAKSYLPISTSLKVVDFNLIVELVTFWSKFELQLV
jgi:hypothetical protein